MAGDAVTLKCNFKTDGRMREIVWYRVSPLCGPPRPVALTRMGRSPRSLSGDPRGIGDTLSPHQP